MAAIRHLALYVIALAAGVAMAPSALAVELPCDVADQLASKAFNRAREAWVKGNSSAAHQLKLAFWDIHELGGKCRTVALLADEMRENKLGMADLPPIAFPTSLPGGCSSPGSGCRVIVSEPKKAISAGTTVNPYFYVFEPPTRSDMEFERGQWKQLSGKALEITMPAQLQQTSQGR